MFTEENLLVFLKVQSNITPADFTEIFGERDGARNFNIFARESWNLTSFLFNKVNGDDREKLLAFINNEAKRYGKPPEAAEEQANKLLDLRTRLKAITFKNEKEVFDWTIRNAPPELIDLLRPDILSRLKG